MSNDVKCKVTERGCVLFNCPGCGCLHSVSTKEPNGMGAKWKWNGDVKQPTFTPSILVRANYTSANRMDDVCHSFVTDGRIRFLGDCTHELAGQTVELPPWDCDHEWEFVDDSFDHEYGCEQIVFERCVHCDETRETDPNPE